MAGIERTLAATDLTERSERAFQRAAQLSRDGRATLALLHVVESGLVAAVRERRHAFAEDYLREWFAKLTETDRAGARFKVESGEPFAVIIEQARERSADLIVVGEPGKKGLKEFFVGTTAERVVRHSDRPVLVVKQPTRHAYRRVLVAVDFSVGASVRSKQLSKSPLAPNFCWCMPGRYRQLGSAAWRRRRRPWRRKTRCCEGAASAKHKTISSNSPPRLRAHTSKWW
jgi:nucleotide-binding universal stress UspA family protein